MPTFGIAPGCPHNGGCMLASGPGLRALDDLAERARRRRMRETRAEFERFLATLPRMSDSTELIREDRD